MGQVQLEEVSFLLPWLGQPAAASPLLSCLTVIKHQTTIVSARFFKQKLHYVI